jgi:menaquinol-cytochrome c reductase iron-sulfur subunit
VSDPHPQSRRDFLSRLPLLLGGAIAAAMTGLGLTSLLSPAFSRHEAPWLRVGPVEPDRISKPRSFNLSWRRHDGWFSGNGQATVFVTKGSDGQLRALSTVCTHLGCAVRWDPGKEQFLCPCHGGAFDATGKVVKGPPTKPLTALETKFEDGVLFVKFGADG